MITKLATVLIVISSFYASAEGVAQVKISLTEHDAPLSKVLKDIQLRSGFIVWCSNDLLDGSKKVSVRLVKVSLDSALRACLRDENLEFSIVNGTIVITKKGTQESPIRTTSTLHGKVLDEDGKPVPGITVQVLGTKTATATNEQGEFVLNNLASDAKLLFTGTSVEPYEISVAGRIEVTIKLKMKVSNLDQIQIIAYGQTTSRLQTGNVVTVKGSEIEKQPVANPILALEGRVAGLSVIQATGIPGTGVVVRIQGQNSIGNGNDPFYVVDGVPYESQMLLTTTGGAIGSSLFGSSGGNGNGYGNPLNYIDPDDIESIEVLKDADATAIYGSKAANGAILITTKKGRGGPLRVNMGIQAGFSKLPKSLKTLNTSDYLSMRHEALDNDGAAPSVDNAPDLLVWDTTKFTNWQKKLIGNAGQYGNYSVTVSGGGDRTQFLATANYHNETTAFPGDFGDHKISMHLSVKSISANDRFKFDITSNYLFDKNKLPGIDFTQYATTLAPNAPKIYNDDGSLNWELNPSGTSTWTNPQSFALDAYNNKTDNFLNNANLAYLIAPGLEAKTSFGYELLRTNEFQGVPLTSIAPDLRSYQTNTAFYTNSNITSWIVEPQLTYHALIKACKADLLVGGTIQQKSSDGQFLNGTGYSNDASLQDLAAASSVTVLQTLNSEYKYSAFFGRLSLNSKDKYLLNVTARRDGSSRFGEKNEFHNFGAIGAAWIFTEEPFLKNRFRSFGFGKLRISYGMTGNDQIGDYRFLNLYYPYNPGVPYQGLVSLLTNSLPNPYLQWEETRKLQFGLDLSFFNNRLTATGNFAVNKSSNQLLPYNISTVAGFSTILTNFPATVENDVFELSVGGIIVKSKYFTWQTNFTYTRPKNRVLTFPNINQSSYANGQNGIIIGQPIGVRKVFHFAGVNTQDGVYQFFDSHGSPTESPKNGTDNTVLVNTSPIYYGGINNSFFYKSFELSFFIQYVKQTAAGNFVFNFVPGDFNGGTGNQPADVLNRWQKPGDVKPIEKYNQDQSLFLSTAYYGNSDAAFGDASYMRLKNVSLSYKLDPSFLRRINIQSFKIFLLGQNLFTITKFQGLDPETQSNGVLPPLRTLTAGIEVLF